MNFLTLTKKCLTPVIPKTFKFLTRFISGRESCIFPVKQICKPRIFQNLTQEKSKGKPKKEHVFLSMWENPECCVIPCPDLPIRMDIYHYKMSDKLKRQYQKTWIECIPIKKPVIRCCFEELDYPPVERRPRKKPCPTTIDCRNMAAECPRFVLDNCRPARNPPKCVRIRGPSRCSKVCAPYPSFSECISPNIKPARQTECKCLKPVPLCVLYDYLRKGLVQKLKRKSK